MTTCRFCEKWKGPMVKYGTRHYAHPRCYLENGKRLADLHAWQIEEFPVKVLSDFGHLDIKTLKFTDPDIQAKVDGVESRHSMIIFD